MAQTPGPDTITPDKCPDLGQSVEVSMDIIVLGTKIQIIWQELGMSIVPYCTQCAAPLTWHRPVEGETLFHCPVCERVWVIDNAWILQREISKRKE
jgi:predicted RNA-binding Zn-ribbon protein involved in translation (DUF1610 family)